MSRVRVGLVVAFVLACSLGALTAHAAAAPTQAGSTASLLAFPPIQGNNPPLLFERFDGSAYAITQGPATSILTNPFNDWGSWVAGTFTGALVAAGEIAVAILEWAFSLDVITVAGGPVDAYTAQLHQALYSAFLPAVILVVGGWAAYVFLISKRLLHGVSGLAWAVVALVLGAVLMAAPTEYLGDASGFSSEVSTAILAGAAQADPGGGATSMQGSSSNAELRVFADRLWTVWVYDPWTFVQFGAMDPKVPGTNNKLGVELLQQQAGQPSTYPQDLAQEPQSIQNWANGQSGAQRLVYSIMMLVVAGVGLLMVGILALIMLGAGILVMILALAMVPVLLLAPIPIWGRAVFGRWFGMLLAAFAVKALAALFLVLLIATTAAINSLSSSIGWFLTALLDLVAVWVLWHVRKVFFTRPTAGARNPGDVPTTEGAHEQHLDPGRSRFSGGKARPMPEQEPGSLPVSRPAAVPRGPVKPPIDITPAWLWQAVKPTVDGAPGSNGKAAGTAAGAAKAGAGAGAKTAGAAAAAGTGATAATGGLALLGVAAVSTGKAAMRGHARAGQAAQGHISHLLHGSDGRSTVRRSQPQVPDLMETRP